MSVVRVVCPELYAHIQENLTKLRTKENVSPEDWEKVEQGVKAALRVVGDDVVARALECLVWTVFGDRGGVLVGGKPQGFRCTGQIDYFRRFSACAISSREEPDQRVLQDLLAWRNCEQSSLLERLVDPNRGPHVTPFAGMLSPKDVTRLVRDVTQRESETSAGAWPGVAPCSLNHIWSILKTVSVKSDMLRDRLVTQIKDLGRTHLPLAQAICLRFGKDNPTGYSPLGEGGRNELDAALHGVLASFTDGSQITAALREGPRLTLFYSSWTNRRITRKEFGGIPFEGWERFSGLLLDAAQSDPETLVPQLLPFVVEELTVGGPERVPEGEEARFAPEAAERLFGLERLKEVMQASGGHELWEPVSRRQFLAVIRALG